MRRHRIIFPDAFLAAAIAVLSVAGCDNNKKDVEAAKASVFDVDFAVIYSAALEATRENYPNLEDAPGRGAIKTAWHQVSNAASPDDPASPSMANGAGIGAANTQAANRAGGGMPTRLAYKRFYIRFDISITGGRPWRLRVVGHASMWEPGASDPEELHGAQRPSWLEGRTDALTAAIYRKIKPYAIPAKEGLGSVDETAPHADASAFTGVPPGAAQALAALKNAASARDFTALRTQLSDDVVWSLGGGTGADVAVATWQADPEPLDTMNKLLAGACGGDAKKVSCPAGPPAPGAYQLVIEPRPLGWRVTSYVKAE